MLSNAASKNADNKKADEGMSAFFDWKNIRKTNHGIG